MSRPVIPEWPLEKAMLRRQKVVRRRNLRRGFWRPDLSLYYVLTITAIVEVVTVGYFAGWFRW